MQTLSDNSGNCIETTLLFDAIFEAIGFHTYFVFITGHVYLAVQEWPDSDRVVPLETTMLGFGTYDQARSTGLDEYRKAPDDQQYLQVDVQKVRNAGIEPTPYMDKMPEGARFYQKIDQVSTEIVSSRQMIEKCSGAMKEIASLPPAAEKNLQDAEALFNNGKYADAEKLAADTMASLTTTSTGSDVATEVLAYAFLLMPVVVIVLAVLYVRARRRRTVAPQAAAATMPAASPVRYCVQCGKEIPLNKNFCKYCGATQQP